MDSPVHPDVENDWYVQVGNASPKTMYWENGGPIGEALSSAVCEHYIIPGACLTGVSQLSFWICPKKLPLNESYPKIIPYLTPVSGNLPSINI